MKYRELLEQFKNGTLNETERAQVQDDIEKHEAISDYLMETAELPALEDLFGGKPSDLSDSADLSAAQSNPSGDFTRRINAYIRRTFIRIGVIVGACVLAIVLFVIFALPRTVSAFYYNPCEIVSISDYIETNRISLDMATYSELFLPEASRELVRAEPEGYGCYSLYLPQTFSYTGTFTDTVGKLTRNKLTFYNPNILKLPSVNYLMPQMAVSATDTGFSGIGAAGEPEDAFAALEKLNDNDFYCAYFTLDQVMSYEQLTAWCAQNNVSPSWCALSLPDEYVRPIGFYYAQSATGLGFDSRKYPLLTYYAASETTDEAHDWEISPENMRQHVVSLLRYMEDHPQFASIMGQDYEKGYFARLAESVESDGIQVYGFTVIGHKDDIQSVAQAKHIAYVYTSQMK